jgi:hypothetical protein
MRKLALAVALAVWAAGWVWGFAFSYSNSYFSYDLCSRLPVFGAAMLGAVAIPVGAVFLWRRLASVVALVIGQAGVALASVAPLAGTTFVLSRIPGRCHLSGDDAMGAGINFLLLAATGVVSVGVMGVAAAIRRARSGTAPASV